MLGPGVTPDVEAEAAGLGKFDPARDGELEQSRLDLYDQITAGDKFCATQRTAVD